MVYFIFEDNSGMPISRLLKHCTYGRYIHFAEGNWNIKNKVLSILENEDVSGVYVFVDCPPNNANAVRVYNSICMAFRCEEMVSVFPIVCIEEVVLKMLLRYYSIPCSGKIRNLVENTVVKFAWENVDKEYKDDSYTGTSLEHVYKYILNNLDLKCLKNKNSRDFGKFYLYDCVCDRKYCKKLNCGDSIPTKAEKLYTSLPICRNLSDSTLSYWSEIGIKLDECSVQSVLEKLRIKFNIICESMGVGKIKINNYGVEN